MTRIKNVKTFFTSMYGTAQFSVLIEVCFYTFALHSNVLGGVVAQQVRRRTCDWRLPARLSVGTGLRNDCGQVAHIIVPPSRGAESGSESVLPKKRTPHRPYLF